MSDVISFLERMGGDAKLRHLGRTGLDSALHHASIEGELREAIVNADAGQLATLLGAKSTLCSIIFPVEGDETEAAPQR